jgi:hypothetical protein
MGRSPTGNADATPETVEQVIEMLRRPLPEGPALTKVFERLEGVSAGGRLPEPRTEYETGLFEALTMMFLSPRDTARTRSCSRIGADRVKPATVSGRLHEEPASGSPYSRRERVRRYSGTAFLPMNWSSLVAVGPM